MSEITNHERPGVYSAYEASSLTGAGSGGGAVVIVAEAGDCQENGPFLWTSYSRALADVGRCVLSEMAGYALKNGAGAVYGIPVQGNYAHAFELAGAVRSAAVMVCDSTELTVQQALRDLAESCSEARKERIAVVCGGEGESIAALIQRAAAINHERVVLAAPGGVNAAAALAGAIAGNVDPALPLSGARLEGVGNLGIIYEDGEIDLLVRGGVTPLETLGGSGYVIRAVTTRTTSGGAADNTWHELTTVLVVDDVIPGIREALRARFNRVKNTGQTRGAIRSQVILELENRVSREIIDGYDSVMVTAKEDDPTVCLVEFAFTVTHGLNQIWLSAHITV